MHTFNNYINENHVLHARVIGISTLSVVGTNPSHTVVKETRKSTICIDDCESR